MNNSSQERVEIIGCTASGKTSLCKTMQKFGWDPIYEPYEYNPFLTSFFERQDCAFELQMCFLLQHYNKIKNANHSSKKIVCDFSLFLDSIYASILLSDKELSVYNELLSYTVSQINPPKYIIKLICPNDVILERIKYRNRDFEKNTDPKFVEELNRRINFYETNCKQIQINSDQINLLNVIEVYEKIVKRIND